MANFASGFSRFQTPTSDLESFISKEISEIALTETRLDLQIAVSLWVFGVRRVYFAPVNFLASIFVSLEHSARYCAYTPCIFGIS